MSRRALILILVLGAWSAQVAWARQTVTSLKPLLITALKTGQAEGELDNRDARAFTRTFGASAPILIDVTRIGGHKEPGCGRLQVVTRQAGVIERDEKGLALPAKDQSLTYQVNYCASGRFPVGEGGE
ncbi:MAG: hypothetical protein IPG66_06345 [Hydrogenophilales bacterium]|nr:hypothetical protein [Hydrogenophilales bacterium]